MSNRSPFLIALAILVGGCAAPKPYWAAADAGRMPTVLRAHLDKPALAIAPAFTKQTGMDSSEFAPWLQRRLAMGIREATGADSIDWVQDITLEIDTVTIAGRKQPIKRAARGTDSGWVLVISQVSSWDGRRSQSYTTTTGVGMNAQFGTNSVDEKSLSMESVYHLSERRSGKPIAYGAKDSRSIYRFYMDSTDWNKASKYLGYRIGEGIPGKISTR